MAKDQKAERSKRKKVELRYPKHAWKPEDLLDFIELRPFTKRWAELGLDDDEDLTALQLFIMIDPRCGKVIKGSKPIRKLRFAPARWKTGKSGAARVLYVHVEALGIVILCLVYGKGEVDNISEAVVKYLDKRVEEVVQELEKKRSI